MEINNKNYCFLENAERMIPQSSILSQLAEKKCLIKWGADPSASDLHFGHLVILRQLRALQDLGHRVQFVIGSFTAQIGDPTGKSKTRPSLSKEQVMSHAQSYQDQVFEILDKSKTDVYYNHEWLDKLSATDIVQLCAQSTVARMLERDDFSKRYQNQNAIGIHEFLYPIMQGYDSVFLKSDIEVGGTDQEFNLLMGRQMQKNASIAEQSVITFPILEGLDGVEKMSKSLGNHIAIKDKPQEIYGKIMSIPDALLLRYFKLLTLKSAEELDALQARLEKGENPKYLKQALAQEMVAFCYSDSEAQKAQENFESIFSKKSVPDDIQEYVVSVGTSLLDALASAAHSFSKKELRRFFQQGAIKKDNKALEDPFMSLDSSGEWIIKIGKRQFIKLIVQ